MEKNVKYAIITISILLAVSLGTACIFGYMWGKGSAENKRLKEEKKEYRQKIAGRDSIIEMKERRVVLLQDSFSRLVKEAIAENDRANSRIIIIKEDEDEIHKEINAVHTVSDDSLVRLFNRLTDSYKPPR